MKRYEIRCTESQTRKALELGAPIDFSSNYYDGFDTIGYSEKYKDKIYAEIPTAEQMLNWLEEQDGIKEVSAYCDVTGTTWYFDIYGYKGNSLVTIKDISNSYGYSSRREATLSAIDAALEYLCKNKE